MRAVSNDVQAHQMRAAVLVGGGGRWEVVGARSAAELEEAVTHYERAAALRRCTLLRR